jgi:predicted GH43/DUF377 family glycosyl hydrolase
LPHIPPQFKEPPAMSHRCAFGWLIAVLLLVGSARADDEFPPELTDLRPYENNPVFAAEGPGHWDVKIRERGWILREQDAWHLWFTGYDGTREGTRKLGYATSPDGIRWTRDAGNPLDPSHWIEDMMVVKDGDTYVMAAEGRHDIAQLLTSRDRVHWQREGSLDVRQSGGKPLEPGPYGTPTLWREGDVWNLFYERGDQGIWLARSTDRKVWTNVSDEPVIARGPEPYDRHQIAMNQVIRHNGRYYTLYHATASAGTDWTTNLAMSTDLVHWKKYPRNPLLAVNQSSGIYVYDGERFRLYIMHDLVRMYLAREPSPE